MDTRYCSFCGFRRSLTGDAYQNHLMCHVRRGEAVVMVQWSLKVVVKPEEVAKYEGEGWTALSKPTEVRL